MAACIQRSPLWHPYVTVLHLTENMCVDRSNADSVQFANWLLDVGHGRGIPLDHSFTIPAHMKLEPATLPALILEIYPKLLVMEKFGSVRFSTLNLQMLNQTIRSVQQFSRTLNGMWRSGSKSVQFTFECNSNANMSWDPPAGARAPVWRGAAAAHMLTQHHIQPSSALSSHNGRRLHLHAVGYAARECSALHPPTPAVQAS